MSDIKNMAVGSGRKLKENNQVVNIADLIEALVNNGIKVSGSTLTDTQALPTKKVNKTVVTTLLNAVSVGAGQSTAGINFDCQGADTVLFAINIDQQPWTLLSTTIFGGASTSAAFYPRFSSHTSAYSDLKIPAIAMPIVQPIENLTAFLNAKPLRRNDIITNLSISNNSANIATVTLKAIQMWRD